MDIKGGLLKGDPMIIVDYSYTGGWPLMSSDCCRLV